MIIKKLLEVALFTPNEFPYTEPEHVVPTIAAVPEPDIATAAQVVAHEPVII
jgi:hypothetical protein